MNELLELNTRQVPFISGLLAGFSLTVAVHILRYCMDRRVAQLVFLMLTLSSLLFLLALYVDVRLSIAFAGMEDLAGKQQADDILRRLAEIRRIGTSSATVALFVFVAAIGLVGWLATPLVGIMSSALAGAVLLAVWSVYQDVGDLIVFMNA